MRIPWTAQVMIALLALVGSVAMIGQEPRQTRPRWATRREPAPEPPPPADRDLEIAAQFAPIIHQGLDGHPRFDYITSFDFDGDWRGDNNWQNAENSSYPLRAYVYYSVIETDTHYFIHYAVFHPRDYKGGLFQSWLLAEAVRRAREQLRNNLPPEAEDLTLSHENDMEGCLVVAEKRGPSLDEALVVYVETMAHNTFNLYRAPNAPPTIGYTLSVEGSRPVLFCEPKGHGLFAYTGQPNQLKEATRGALIYHYTGQAEDPEQATDKKIGYRLMPIYETLWQRARANATETYGEAKDFGSFGIKALENGKVVEKQPRLEALGAAFLGVMGAANKARPPWGWVDYRERQRPPGEWFFDPASIIKRHYYAYTLSTVYVHHPYLDVWRRTKP
jgi:hypothetical protein